MTTTVRLASKLGLSRLKVWEGNLLDKVGKSFYELRANSIDGSPFDMESVKNKVVLVSNIASSCSFAPSNFRVLRDLDSKYRDELQILAFPSNEFGKKEPLSPGAIRTLLESEKIKCHLMEKAQVNGPSAHEVFKALKLATGTEDIDIAWNFETKFLIAREGQHVERYSNAASLEDLLPFIDRLVGELDSQSGDPNDAKDEFLTKSPASFVNTG
jgi:glutathione peroxidase-family protein